MTKENKQWGLSGNQIKILALIAMTCDHVGKQLLPELLFLQIIGRLAFPLFAFMIAEGCIYTKNRRKYLGRMIMVAILCQVVYDVFVGSLYQCILVTFCLSVVLIYLLDWARKCRNLLSVGGFLLAVAVIYFVSCVLPELLSGMDFTIDYGFWGVLYPVLIYGTESHIRAKAKDTDGPGAEAGAWLIQCRWPVLLVATAALVAIALDMGGLQWYALLGLIPLAFYNGSRGKWPMKSFFYFYYPLHLAAIYGTSMLLAFW